MDEQQYTDAQLSDGRTLRFLGQLGPDEVRQKVQTFRTRESALGIEANPPGVPRPRLKDALGTGMHESPWIGNENERPMPGVSDGANLAEGLSDWDRASFGEMG